MLYKGTGVAAEAVGQGRFYIKYDVVEMLHTELSTLTNRGRTCTCMRSSRACSLLHCAYVHTGSP